LLNNSTVFPGRSIFGFYSTGRVKRPRKGRSPVEIGLGFGLGTGQTTLTKSFEDQEGGIPLLAVRRLLWQRGASVWTEAIFLAPTNREDMARLVESSLQFRKRANGYVIDFVAPGFLVELIGSDPSLVGEMAGRVEKLYSGWKKQKPPEPEK
jgi:hypothetical protein